MDDMPYLGQLEWSLHNAIRNLRLFLYLINITIDKNRRFNICLWNFLI